MKPGRRSSEAGPRDPHDPTETVWPGRTAVPELSAVGTALPAGPGLLRGSEDPEGEARLREGCGPCPSPHHPPAAPRTNVHRESTTRSALQSHCRRQTMTVASLHQPRFTLRGRRVRKGPGYVGWDRGEACGGRRPAPGQQGRPASPGLGLPPGLSVAPGVGRGAAAARLLHPRDPPCDPSRDLSAATKDVLCFWLQRVPSQRGARPPPHRRCAHSLRRCDFFLEFTTQEKEKKKMLVRV